MNETERFLTSAELAELAALIDDILSDPSPASAAKRAGVTFEYPPDLRGVVVSVGLPRNTEHVGYIAIVFDQKPHCAVPPSQLLKLDGLLLRVADESDKAAIADSTRREIQILKSLGRACERAANLANQLSHTPPAGPLPWRTAGAVFWAERDE